MPRDHRRRSQPSGRMPLETASLEVSCEACHRLHAPERPFDTNSLCAPCEASDPNAA